ncbi:MAG: LolA family protein [Minwuia sp.]|uniref:LolA family protein n=1 Tax=Minwuia sp. TaxID=2493630 RepID=UPI003A8A82E6
MISRAAAFVAAFLAAAPAFALTDAESSAVGMAEDYLQSIRTVQADFVQQAESGARAQGELLMRRPGLIRFQYAPPSKVVLISDGSLVSFIDYEVGQLTQWPLSDTPLAWLVRKDIDLEKDAIIDEVEAGGGELRFRLRDPDRADQGSIRFHFLTGPMRLIGWELTDQQDQTTTVALTNLAVNGDLPPNAFRYEEPKAPWDTER